MFGFGKRKPPTADATADATKEIAWVKGVAEKRGVAGLLFWSDSYLLGFVQGLLAVVIGGTGAELNEADKTCVYVDSIMANGMADAVPLLMLMQKLTEDQDPNFIRGSQHGMNVMLLQTGQFPPQAYDATIKQAIADAGNVSQWAAEEHKFGAAPNVDAAAALALRELYLGPHLAKHFARHVK